MKRRNELLNRVTGAELIVKELLETLGVKFTSQKIFFNNKENFRIVDFYLHKPYRIALEIDGQYHEKTKDYDGWKDFFLRQRSDRIKIVRFKNEDVFKSNFKDILKKIL